MTKHFLLTIICLMMGQPFLQASFASAQEVCSEINASQQVDRCSEIAKKAADSQLNTSYHQLMARLEVQYQADPEAGAAYALKVKETQRIWIKSRDSNCPLEAFEIEPGTSAYVTTVNNCIARMSLERAKFLDNTAPGISSVPSTKTESEDACPSRDFRQFLPVFSASGESQKRFTAKAVKILVVKHTVDSGRFEPVITAQAGSDLSFPLMAAFRAEDSGDFLIESVDDSHVNLIDKRAGYSNIKIYNFARQACWALTGVEDWSISERELSTSARSGMSRAENQCLQRAYGFSGLGGLQLYPLTAEFFNAALENYLCAAASGDPQASLNAASLSLSGMAPQLPSEKVEALLKAAATTLADGAAGLSTFYCYGNDIAGSGPCQRPLDAEKWLIRAASMGSTDALVYLGSTFESGDMGTKDIPRALACYQLASDKGNPNAPASVTRLTSQLDEPANTTKCY
ncbi:DUF1311 domain-containing protein [Pseudomonas sp. CDFA 553]|uniref:lysozyme inhibitor LprI family protein n=1 Tax=Pseudomonas quasicaspiana TaxID=2829821 RepID=UPI001E47F75A|nr:lysozyme inhibitor LprI family protein [Pseudomonas quasicaspiana]MCD5990466.1 DUF1311 domain-containing protein [Pseudomonas quasicaspiana]